MKSDKIKYKNKAFTCWLICHYLEKKAKDFKARIRELEDKIEPKRSHGAIWEALDTLAKLAIIKKEKHGHFKNGESKAGSPYHLYTLIDFSWRKKIELPTFYSKHDNTFENLVAALERVRKSTHEAERGFLLPMNYNEDEYCLKFIRHAMAHAFSNAKGLLTHEFRIEKKPLKRPKERLVPTPHMLRVEIEYERFERIKQERKAKGMYV